MMHCLVFPAYVKAHVEVTGWTQSSQKIVPGKVDELLVQTFIYIYINVNWFYLKLMVSPRL